MTITLPPEATAPKRTAVNVGLLTATRPRAVQWQPGALFRPLIDLPISTMATSVVLEEQTSPALSVQVESGDGYLMASDRSTGIFGVGPTLGDAFSDLAAALVEHRDVLERQDQLSPELARHLEYLQRLPR